ncbi:MAG TPA: hypothetical protein VMU00_09945 [Steroidobacteraceae bacterium]|nr:hypothetical protein [Steroidobacteraceae bacterium]
MKRLLLVLLLANLAFFGYARLSGEESAAPPAAEAPAAIPRLALLSELKAPAGPGCLSIGPFAERAIAVQAGGWLRDTHHVSRERSGEVDGPPTYWVMLTTKTVQQALQIKMRLKAASVDDVEVTPPGSNQTEATVSFGVYSERERADRRQTELRRLAVGAQVVEQQHKLTHWWLDVPQRPGDPPLDAAALHKAVPAAAAATISPCPAVAPTAAPAGGPVAAPAAPSSPAPAPAKLPGAPA